jgi:tetratricopeptide (TPR) repeat protein
MQAAPALPNNQRCCTPAVETAGYKSAKPAFAGCKASAESPQATWRICCPRIYSPGESGYRNSWAMQAAPTSQSQLPHLRRQSAPGSCTPVAIALALALSLLPALVRADVSVRASLAPLRAQVGESLALSIDFSGAQDAAPPTLPPIPGFELSYRGPSTQVSIMNGQMNASVQHRYALLAMQPGRFTVGPFSAEYKGTQYQTASFNVEVVPAAQGSQAQAGGDPGGQRALRLNLSVPRSEVYLNERLPIDINLYVGPVRAGDVQYPIFTADGFSIDKFTEPTQHQESIDGQTVQVLHFQTTLMPLRSGALSIGPAALTLSVYDRRRGGGGFFDDSFFADRHPVTLRSDPVVLNVLPLPEEGKPPSFSGAVGSFTLDVSAAPVELNAGDPVTLTMTVRGQGHLPDTAAPALSTTRGFRTYETHATKSEGDSKSFEQVLIPTDPRVAAVPAVRFSFFDPEKRRYEVLDSQAVGLTVRPPQQPQHAEIVSSGARPPKPEELGRDIVYIKDDPGTLSPRRSGLPVAAWPALPLPLLLFGAATWYDRQRTRLTGDLRYARFTRAGRMARESLAKAEQALLRQDRAAFYDAIFRTLQDYLAAKLDLPPGGIDANAAASRGLPDDVVQAIRQLLDSCEQARFAPVGEAADLQATLAAAQGVVKRLERDRRLTAAPHAALLMLAIVLGSTAVVAADNASPQTSFFHANALYKDGQFAAAAAEYEEILAQGLGSGNLYFNLGNAYFKAGEKGKAVLNYERARHLLPVDPDVAANLSYARSLTGAEACAPSLWARLAFPLAQRVARAGLTWATLSLYSLCALALTAYRGLPAHPRALLYVAAAGGALLLLAGMSLSRQIYVGSQPRAVVVVPGNTPARFEPAANGTEHYALKEGTLVTISDRRDGWLQVTRCDGLRGWIEAKTIEPLEKEPPSQP